MVQAMQESYDNDVTDEFVKPINNSTVDGTVKPDDCVIFFNYRNDRAKELTEVLTQKDMPEEGMHTIPGLQYYCMTPTTARSRVCTLSSTRRMLTTHLPSISRPTAKASSTSPPKQRSMPM